MVSRLLDPETERSFLERQLAVSTSAAGVARRRCKSPNRWLPPRPAGHPRGWSLLLPAHHTRPRRPLAGQVPEDPTRRGPLLSQNEAKKHPPQRGCSIDEGGIGGAGEVHTKGEEHVVHAHTDHS